MAGRDGGAGGEGRQSGPFFFTQEVCFNVTLFLLLHRTASPRKLCVPLPCIGATFWLGEVICFRM